MWRWVNVASPLPREWQAESKIRYSVTILDRPEYRDAQTVVRSGIWYISLRGYREIIPGSRVVFEGIVEPKWILGKVTQIKMIDPEIEILCTHTRCVGALHTGYVGEVMIVLGQWRERWVKILQKNLPEPMASLAGGILLGIKGQMPQDFYQALVSTGTLHIVAASGYNVSIVATVLMNLIGVLVTKGVGIGIGIVGIILYVLISGGSASVVRAGIMGSLTLIAYYFGRPAEAKRLLFVTAGVMLMINPLMLIDIGFQLSFVATAGLLYIEPLINNHKFQIPCLRRQVQFSNLNIHKFLKDYLYPTLAATIATMPVILWHFGRVSLISPLVNILVLPTIPLIMGMTALTIVGGQVVAWVTYPLLAYVVWVIELFG
ncbi:MAG: ComEC/Rec2 family competence protein [bacterium]